MRSAVRNEEKGKPWKALGADIASADFDDAVSLTRAFENLGERPFTYSSKQSNYDHGDKTGGM